MTCLVVALALACAACTDVVDLHTPPVVVDAGRDTAGEAPLPIDAGEEPLSIDGAAIDAEPDDGGSLDTP